jgi:hypothetical protein
LKDVSCRHFASRISKGSLQASKREGVHLSLSHIIQQLWRQEGIWGFFGGLRVKLLQSVLAAALMFVMKERLQKVAIKALSIA